MPGTLLVSLDLELYWGIHDLYTPEQAKPLLMRARPAIQRILDLFEEFEVHATWATVGFLFFRNREELFEGLPRTLPDYSDPRLSPYRALLRIGANEVMDPMRFGPSILEAIQRTPHQEIGTHTFSHYYCLEDGQSERPFRNDLEAAIRAATAWDVNLASFVFPRNQIHPGYLETLRELGILSYRGNQRHWLYRERKGSNETQFRRAIRLLDAYVNLSGHHSFDPRNRTGEAPFNFPASRLLRGYSPTLRALEPLRLKRICSGLDHAAKKKQVYHLWFHPEDFAVNEDENADVLRKILQRFSSLRNRGQMDSLSMAELALKLDPPLRQANQEEMVSQGSR